MKRIAVLVSWLASTVAIAQPVLKPSPAGHDDSPASSPLASAFARPPLAIARKEKNPMIALALSAGTTVIGGGLLITAAALEEPQSDFKKNSALLGLMGGGIVAVLVGPTLGHVYAGDAWNRWLRLRLLGAGGVVAGGLIAGASANGDACGFPGTSCSSAQTAAFGLGILLVAGGAISYIVGMGAEIGSAPRAADRYNRQLSIAPLATTQALGLALAGTF